MRTAPGAPPATPIVQIVVDTQRGQKMAEASHGTGGLTFDTKKRAWPNEVNVFIALILIVLIFEGLGQLLPYMKGQSMLFDFNVKRDGTILNMARIKIIILQVSIIGIIALGVTQVIITGGIDLSSGSVVGATAMIAMSFAQTELVNGNPNPKAILGPWAMDLPIVIPLIVGLLCGLAAGAINGILIAYTRIPPFIATIGMMVSARGGRAETRSHSQPMSMPPFPTATSSMV